MHVYKFLNAKYALEALEKRRLKIARINELNDPFELLGTNLTDQELIYGEGRAGRVVLEMRTHPRWGRELHQDVTVPSTSDVRAETWLLADGVVAGDLSFSLTWLSQMPVRGVPLDRIRVREDSIPVRPGKGWTKSSAVLCPPPGAAVVRFCIGLSPLRYQ